VNQKNKNQTIIRNPGIESRIERDRLENRIDKD
jgi:hypothetical protein